MAEISEPLCILHENCPLRQMFDLVGNRWSTSVLFVIGEQVKRYSELQRQIPGVSKKMLTETLRKLEQGGLINRKIEASIPPKTEYRLTELGKSILQPITALANWAVEHQEELRQLRDAPNPEA